VQRHRRRHPGEPVHGSASAIFSHGSLGTPGCENTLNRVPELPKAHDGSSIRCALNVAVTHRRASGESSVIPALHKFSTVSDHIGEAESEQVRHRSEVRHPMAGGQCPVGADPAGTPVFDPLAGVATEVDARSCCRSPATARVHA
jgi:hypothetical protein